MGDFDKYDLAEGFVLSQKQAIEYFRRCVAEEFEEATGKLRIDCDSASAGAFFEDVVAMAQTILDKDWAWVKFSECAPSASGIMIKEMKEE